MTKVDRRRRAQHRRAPAVALVTAVVAFLAATFTAGGPSAAQAPGVSGEAFGHYTKVGLFGGPPGIVGPAPRVFLPPGGSDGPITGSEPDGASAVFGPATIFGGKWPADLGTAPKSGPVNVSTEGTPGPNGSVTSTASITLHPKPVPVTCDGQAPETKNCTSPGGFGPVVPNEGDELRTTCTANAQGVTGSTRIVNGKLATSTDEGGEPKDQEPIPENPPPNYTRTGVITNVGDKFRIVYNEQFVDPDGSITVNGIHMYLLGDIAVGEQILGHVRCSMKPAESSATTAIAGPSTTAPTTTSPPPTTTPTKAGSSKILPLALGGAALVLGLAMLFFFTRRRGAEPTDTTGMTPDTSASEAPS